jgi:hypothetical protein
MAAGVSGPQPPQSASLRPLLPRFPRAGPGSCGTDCRRRRRQCPNRAGTEPPRRPAPATPPPTCTNRSTRCCRHLVQVSYSHASSCCRRRSLVKVVVSVTCAGVRVGGRVGVGARGQGLEGGALGPSHTQQQQQPSACVSVALPLCCQERSVRGGALGGGPRLGIGRGGAPCVCLGARHSPLRGRGQRWAAAPSRRFAARRTEQRRRRGSAACRTAPPARCCGSRAWGGGRRGGAGYVGPKRGRAGEQLARGRDSSCEGSCTEHHRATRPSAQAAGPEGGGASTPLCSQRKGPPLVHQARAGPSGHRPRVGADLGSKVSSERPASRGNQK